MGLPVGISNLYIAKMNADESYETPIAIDAVASVSRNPNSSTATFYGDNTEQESAISLGKIDVEITAKSFPIELLAIIFGHTQTGATLVKKSTDLPPYVAIGWEVLNSDGHKDYYWLLKAKFMLPENAWETKGESITFQPQTLKAQGTARDSDGAYERVLSEEDTNFVSGMETDFFTYPDDQAADSAAPTVVTVPDDAATNVVITSNITVTFDKTMAYDTLNSSNIILMTTAGVVIAAAYSVDAARKVVTINPTASLGAGVEHSIIVTSACKTVWGVAAPSTLNQFTTAA